MVGNAYPYTINDWCSDIRLAQTHHFDAFALNVGNEEWQKARVLDGYEAARQLHTGFKLFLSFDMTSIPGGSGADIEFLRRYLELVGHHPNQLMYQGRALVSTFAGDQCTFGQTSLAGGWSVARSILETVCPVHFIPAFFIDPTRYPTLSCIDGIFHWNGGWPIHLTKDSPREEIECPALDTDRHHLQTLRDRTYMAAVSPWFFTHYGPDSWDKNWTYRGDDWLLVRRWEHLLARRNAIDIVQFISWNDYGESHYIAPAWVDGFSHAPWLELNAYFARAFKEGRMPPIERDKIFVWARPHPKNATAPDAVPRPRDWELVSPRSLRDLFRTTQPERMLQAEDKFWVVVFARAPCMAFLAAGDERPRRFTCPAGVSKLSCPLRIGHGMRAELVRDRVVVARCDPREYRFEAEPEAYNFNAYVAASE
ncbi:glycoside hydrolase family 71 protein [Russula earlei]|uniref:Glycoside hydrolase family 71 protein n=1 Tax=Russula earlei TaxID=71964 RepID=A0ACC0UIJ3_9AGAM|nr:glycoside hydrolase family 71 protein [Russula earlei]